MAKFKARDMRIKKMGLAVNVCFVWFCPPLMCQFLSHEFNISDQLQARPSRKTQKHLPGNWIMGANQHSSSIWRIQFGMLNISCHPKSWNPFSCYRGKSTDHCHLGKTNMKTYIKYFLVGFWWCSLSQLFNSNRYFNLFPFWDPKSLSKKSTKNYSVSYLTG